MKKILTISLLIISVMGNAQSEKIIGMLELADLMKSKDQPKYTYKAFILYDWYEDYRAIIPAQTQLSLGLPDKSIELKTCLNRIQNQTGYHKSQKQVVEVLVADRQPTIDCKPVTIRRQQALAGSGASFKTTKDVLLAYSLMDEEGRKKFKSLSSPDLTSELEKFETKTFFGNFSSLVESEQLEFPTDLSLNAIQVDWSNQELENLFNSQTPTELGQTLENSINIYLNKRDMSRDLEKKLSKSLELLRKEELKSNAGGTR